MDIRVKVIHFFGQKKVIHLIIMRKITYIYHISVKLFYLSTFLSNNSFFGYIFSTNIFPFLILKKKKNMHSLYNELQRRVYEKKDVSEFSEIINTLK